MTHVGYVVAGYALTALSMGGYAAWVLARRRALARVLAGEEPARR